MKAHKLTALPKTPTDVLIGALKLFKDGKAWTIGSLHENYSGEQETFCALGAISIAADGRASYCNSGVAKEAANLLAEVTIDPSVYGRRVDRAHGYVPHWNDRLPRGAKGFKEVKAKFCEAIKLSLERAGVKAKPPAKAVKAKAKAKPKPKPKGVKRASSK